MNFWQKIREARKHLKELENERAIVEFDEAGFSLMWDRWPILSPCCQKVVRWDEVTKIDVAMRDCFAAHIVSLVFYDEKDKYMIHIHEDVKGYSSFIKYVKEKFPGFNCSNFEAIEMMFPSDINFPCWDREKRIGDLEIRREDEKILWKDNQEIFLQWNDEEQKTRVRGIRGLFRRIFYGESTCL